MITKRLLEDEDLLFLKRPEARSATDDPAIAQRVSEMLLELQRDGEDALRRYARDLDGWERPTSSSPARRSTAPRLDPELREHLERSRERVEAFARAQRSTLSDLEVEVSPGVIAGHRLVPVQRVGAYLPAGRFPLLASAFMTVLVPKVAGVETVVACAPPRRDGTHPPGRRPRRATSAAPTAFRHRRRAGARGDGVRPGRDRARRHDRRRGQRLRRRGQAPALRARRHRPARRAVGDRDHRGRHRRPRARRRRPARPGRARPHLARRADHHVRGPRRGRAGGGLPAARGARRRRRSPAPPGATTARSSSPATARRRRRSATSSPPSTSRCRPPRTTPGSTRGCATTGRSSSASARRWRSRTRARRAPTTCCRPATPRATPAGSRSRGS